MVVYTLMRRSSLQQTFLLTKIRFSVPNPFTFKTPSLYAGAVESSLVGRVHQDYGHFSDTVQICMMFDSWMQFRITNRGPRNKVCRQFGAAHGVHSFRLEQLESTVSLVSRGLETVTSGKVQAELQALCSVHHRKKWCLDRTSF